MFGLEGEGEREECLSAGGGRVMVGHSSEGFWIEMIIVISMSGTLIKWYGAQNQFK